MKVINEVAFFRLMRFKVLNDAVTFSSNWLSLSRIDEIERFFNASQPADKVETSVREVDD